MASRWVPNVPVIKTYTRNQATLLVARTAREVEESAKRLAPVRKPNENGRAGGRLRASIGTRMGGTTYVVTARVGSRLNYAEPAHQGANFTSSVPAANSSFRSNGTKRPVTVSH